MPVYPALASQDYCYITTTGRVTGKPHEIEIWFALVGDTIYILAGGGHDSGWVKNVKKQPGVPVRIGKKVRVGIEANFTGTARFVTAKREDALARRLLLEKYAAFDDLDEWGRTALPVAFELA